MPKRQTTDQVPSEYCPQPEVQCIHVPAHRLLRAIQVLLQPLFSPRRTFPVCSCSQNWYAALLAGIARVIFDPPSGFLVTYIAPLAFVLLVTMGKEAYDDYKRNLRDREANSARYLVLAPHSSSNNEDLSNSRLEDNLTPTRSVPSSSIRVGDLVLLEKDQRVPADLVLLRTSDSSGTCFIRTDQLDGETDWKLRVTVPATQKLPSDQELLNLDAEIYGSLPLFRHQSCRLPFVMARSGCADQGHSRVHRHVYDQHTTQHIL
jgi:magnesium-transporting ATPase (P-type)